MSFLRYDLPLRWPTKDRDLAHAKALTEAAQIHLDSLAELRLAQTVSAFLDSNPKLADLRMSQDSVTGQWHLEFRDWDEGELSAPASPADLAPHTRLFKALEQLTQDFDTWAPPGLHATQGQRWIDAEQAQVWVRTVAVRLDSLKVPELPAAPAPPRRSRGPRAR